MRRMKQAIEDNGEIHQWDLVKNVNIPIKKFYELKSYFLHQHRDEIDFDKKTKSFFILSKKLQEEKREELIIESLKN